jgi:hypothetical protein
MDTILNFNASRGSQLMPDSWLEMTGAVEEPEARGDFISLVSRNGPEKVLADTVEKHWNKLAGDEEYRREVAPDPAIFRLRSGRALAHARPRRFEIGLGAELPSVEELSAHVQFLRSDHARSRGVGWWLI